jgi:hypothetical protein
VLPIWEGTTNVLALDTLRALRTDDADPSHGLRLFDRAVMNCVDGVNNPALVNVVRSGLDHAASWLAKGDSVEAGARRFSLTLGRTIELALMIKHAQHAPEFLSSAQRFASVGVDVIF